MTKDELFAAVVDGVHILPVFHERLEAADQVRRALDTAEFDAVAVEVPASLERAWLSAVARLPAISVVLYETARRETVYLPVHPADPMVEAARSATERGLKLACADLDVDGYADYRDPVPDPYSLLRLGLGKVYGVYRFKSLERSDLAGSQNLMDMVTFRELYGVMTQEMKQELATIREEVGARAVDRDSVEDALFGEDAAIEQAQEELRLAQERFRVGAGSTLERINAEVNLSSARADEVEAICDFLINKARLERAVGRRSPHARGH